MKYQVESIQVNYDDSLNCIVWEMKGFANLSQIKLSAERALELINDNKADSILNDQTASTQPDLEQQDWVIDEWFPALVDAGLKSYAVVVPEDFYNSLSENIRSAEIGSMELRYFSSLEEAQGWLRRK